MRRRYIPYTRRFFEPRGFGGHLIYCGIVGTSSLSDCRRRGLRQMSGNGLGVPVYPFAISLHAAQDAFQGNWTAAYRRYVMRAL